MRTKSRLCQGVAGLALPVLVACAPADEQAATPVPAPAPGSLVTETEVERPDLYAETALALWDGRPSIGGIWVANPDVERAERVVITATASGVTTAGALLRRDASLPGPPFLLSNEAAAALGAEPGVPIEIEVIALRREVVEAPAPVAPPEEEPIAAAPEGETPPENAELPVEPEGEEIAPAEPDAPETPGAGETVPEEAALAAPEEPVETAAAEPEAPIEEPVAPPPAPEPPVVVAAPAQAAAAPDPAPPAEPAPGPLNEPYIQIGTFSVAANATNLRDRLVADGYSVRLAPFFGSNRTLTRVLVGPAATVAERDALVARLAEDGFTDIILTTE
ncbi:MAG: SPOR domain-containing protein [Rubricella sp.]